MKHYDKDFKIEAAKQVSERGYNISEVAKRLGVNRISLSNWVKKYTPNPVQSKQNDLEIENAKLRKQLKRAEDERDILKKATAFFAKESE